MLGSLITVLLALASILLLILVSVILYLEIRERLPTDEYKTAVNYLEKAKIRSPLVAQSLKGERGTQTAEAEGNSSSVDLEKFWKKK